ncbi:MAG TPA: hypothetical protein VHG32_10835 [Thermoanaerobaculia bacterium]|nr:hypothetical protein [Thermoanaerobaculia bacterium]
MRSLPLGCTDPLGNSTTFAYDTLGRLTTRTLPQVGAQPAVETTAYDDANDQVTATEAEGRATVTTYDRQHRPVEVLNAARGTKVYQYDLVGNKTLESDWSDLASPRHDTTFVYDDAGRLRERDEPLGRGAGVHEVAPSHQGMDDPGDVRIPAGDSLHHLTQRAAWRRADKRKHPFLKADLSRGEAEARLRQAHRGLVAAPREEKRRHLRGQYGHRRRGGRPG